MFDCYRESENMLNMNTAIQTEASSVVNSHNLPNANFRFFQQSAVPGSTRKTYTKRNDATNRGLRRATRKNHERMDSMSLRSVGCRQNSRCDQ
jgi:hypothetical protein